MAEHPNATVVREMNEAMANGDMEGAASRVADDVVWHEIGRAEPRRGKAELAASMGDFQGYDITWDIHDVLASDDHVIALGTATATHGDRKLVIARPRSTTSETGRSPSAGRSRTTRRRSRTSSPDPSGRDFGGRAVAKPRATTSIASGVNTPLEVTMRFSVRGRSSLTPRNSSGAPKTGHCALVKHSTGVTGGRSSTSASAANTASVCQVMWSAIAEQSRRFTVSR